VQKNFKVNIGVVGRFWLFDLALQLKKFGVLNKLITTYPKFIATRWGIPNEYVVSNFLLELLNRFNQLNFLKKINFYSNYLHRFIMRNQANSCANLLEECDIFIGSSSSSLEALKRSKKLGKMTILERGSPHILFQIDNIKKENSINNINANFKPNIFNIRRDLMEYKLADYIFLPSTFCKETFLRYGTDKTKLIVNPYGVDINNFRPKKKKDNVFRIIFSGGGSFRKGYHYLLKAFYDLNLSNAEVWHLGNINEDMQTTFQKYKKNNWILKGTIQQDKLADYYSQGTVLILPSTDEGLALVTLQAMACGLSIICTHNTGVGDIIENGKQGFIIPARKIDILKRKILFMYNNPNIAKKMGILARKKIVKDCSWDHYGARYLKNIQNLYNKKYLK
jgi:glycosyltransferase involved in cell wall biosynthesis